MVLVDAWSALWGHWGRVWRYRGADRRLLVPFLWRSLAFCMASFSSSLFSLTTDIYTTFHMRPEDCKQSSGLGRLLPRGIIFTSCPCGSIYLRTQGTHTEWPQQEEHTTEVLSCFLNSQFTWKLWKNNEVHCCPQSTFPHPSVNFTVQEQSQ